MSIRLPPRIQLNELDNATGSYPTISRIGDIRTGRYESLFDDTDVVIFDSRGTVSMPLMLPPSSKFLTGSDSLIVTSGVIRKGVSDANISFVRKGQDFTPFNELSFGINDRTDPFYSTGSSVNDVGFGFSSPLWSKTKLEIDLSPIEKTTMNMGFYGTLNPVQSKPMSYFNFREKRWETIGLNESYSETSVLFASHSIGFAPSNEFVARGAGQEDNLRRHSGLPIDTFAFPNGHIFHATSSQTYQMKDLIDRPFVVEKFVYEFSGSQALGSFSAGANPLTNCTFFILNQRRNVSLRQEIQVISASQVIHTHDIVIPANRVISPNGTSIFVDSSRDIITYANVAAILPGQSSELIDNSQKELVIYQPGSDMRWSGKFILSGSIKSPSISTLRSGFARSIGTFGDVPSMNTRWLQGGRNNLGIKMISGRDFTSAVTAFKQELEIQFVDEFVTIQNEVDKFNPYIILPTDELILGWQAPAEQILSTGFGRTGYQLTLAPEAGRLVLYGSQLREGVEFHDTLNQNLTSHAIHEALHYDNPVIDQFDIEPKNFFSGSFFADVVTGSMSTGPGHRAVRASRAISSSFFVDGDIAIDHELRRARIQSFSRLSKHISTNERVYDTVLPKISDILTRNGVTIIGVEDDYALVALGAFAFSAPFLDRDWNYAFPFEPKYNEIPRLLSQRGNFRASRDFATNDPIDRVFDNVVLIRYGLRSDIWLGGSVTVQHRISSFSLSIDEVLLDLYSIGSFVSGTADYASSDTIPSSLASGHVFGPKPRGFKYGIYNTTPSFSSAQWRRDRYGQFRDLLEQRIDTSFYDVEGVADDGSKTTSGLRSSPVTCKFVERGSNRLTHPYKTYCSNVDRHATSSLPYFDGVVRNREEPLDTSELNSETVTI